MFAGGEEKHTDIPNKTPSARIRLSPQAFQGLRCKKASRGAIRILLIRK